HPELHLALLNSRVHRVELRPVDSQRLLGNRMNALRTTAKNRGRAVAIVVADRHYVELLGGQQRGAAAVPSCLADVGIAGGRLDGSRIRSGVRDRYQLHIWQLW